MSLEWLSGYVGMRKVGEVLRDYSRAEDGGFRLPLGFDVELDDDGPEDD